MNIDRDDELDKILGMVWSEENEAWVHSQYGMGLTSQIASELAEALLQLLKERELALLSEVMADLYEIADTHEGSTKVWNRHKKYLNRLAQLTKGKVEE